MSIHGLFTAECLLPILQRTSDGVAIVAPAPWRVIFANRMLADWLRKSEHEMADLHLDELFGDAWDRAKLKAHVEAALLLGSTDLEVIVELPLVDSEHGKTRLRIVRILSDDTPFIALMFQPVGEDAESLSWHVRRLDPLTDLPDRAYLLSRLETLLKGDRAVDRDFAVVFVDLDDFKRVNDGHGHLVGDRVLREVSQRLRNCVREGDHVTRFGGDEFVILLERVSGMAEIEPVLARMRSALAEPFELYGQSVMLSLSVGVARSAPHHRTPEDVLGEADREMYAAKRVAVATTTKVPMK
jgi:diguanylate cyclase (GGDEF)-like protein